MHLALRPLFFVTYVPAVHFPIRIKDVQIAHTAPHPQQKVQIVQPLASHANLEHIQHANRVMIVKNAITHAGGMRLYMVHRLVCTVR
jgi:hypothetical protein